MKKHFCLSSACGALIAVAGAMVPLASLQAADRDGKSSDAVKNQSVSTSSAADDQRYGSGAAKRGAEGPIRTDNLAAEKVGGATREDVARDMRQGRYPMENGVGIP